MSDPSARLAEYMLERGPYSTAAQLGEYVKRNLPGITEEQWMRGFAIAEELSVVDILMNEPSAIDPFRVPACRKPPVTAA